MAPKISIIIPVYNAEKTLRRAVESVVYGKMHDIEVILVDDCSTDGSFALCQMLSDEFSSVRAVRNPKNCGVSYTRNHGLQESRGEYILFIDSDDWVSCDYASALLETTLAHQGSLAVCGFMFIDHTNGSIHCQYLFDTEKSITELKKHDYYILADKIHAQTVWNKLFRTDIIRQNNIRFREDMSMGEDFQFVLDYLEKGNIEQCVIVNRPLYYYVRYHGNSLMGNFAKEPFERAAGRMEQLGQICGHPEHAKAHIEQLRQNYTYHIVRDKRMNKSDILSALNVLWPDGSAKARYREGKIISTKEWVADRKNVVRIFCERVKGRLDREVQKRKINAIRAKLKNTDVSIISQNCIGGVFCHDMGLQFLSPTVNLYFDAPDYLRFVSNLKYYCSLTLRMEWGDEYPIGYLDDVKIYFMHYNTCAEAKEAWERRVMRIRYDNIVVLSTDRNGFGDAEYEQWKKLPCRKLLFTVHPEYDCDSVQFPEFAADGCVPDLIHKKRFYKQSKILDVVNRGE